MRVLLFPKITAFNMQYIPAVVAHLINPGGDPVTVHVCQLGDTQVAGHDRWPQLVVAVTQDLIEPVREPVATASMLGSHIV